MTHFVKKALVINFTVFFFIHTTLTYGFFMFKNFENVLFSNPMVFQRLLSLHEKFDLFSITYRYTDNKTYIFENQIDQNKKKFSPKISKSVPNTSN